MIIIGRTPFDASALLSEYPENSVERLVLKQLQESTETYQYDTVEQLKFELSLRKEIVNASRALNRSGMRFSVFHKSECNSAYWERTQNGGFRLKNGVKPSDAISDIFINGRMYATECATAMVIVYYKALLDVMGEDTFNRLFPSIYLMNWHQLPPLLRDVGIPKRVSDILIGDRCYFKNPQVNPEVMELQGENVIVLPGGLYYGHGIGITSAETIIRVLNANRIEGAVESAYFVENSAARPNFKRLYNASQPQQAARTLPVLQWRPFPPPITRPSTV